MIDYEVWIKHFILLFAAISMMYTRDRFASIHRDLTTPSFVLFTCLIILFGIWGMNHKEYRVRISTQRALIAFMVAYMAHSDMVFIVPIAIYIFSYHFNVEDPVTN